MIQAPLSHLAFLAVGQSQLRDPLNPSYNSVGLLGLYPCLLPRLPWTGVCQHIPAMLLGELLRPQGPDGIIAS